MGEEIRVFGPPGTGKTTWLHKKINATAKYRGSDAVVVGSFTKAAAAEIAGRGLLVPEGQVGTLHSLALRAIGNPDVAAGKIEDWNRKHHDLRLDPTRRHTPDEPQLEAPSGALTGEAQMAQVEILRARRVPEAKWPLPVRLFYQKWCGWKDDLGVIDFTDMIENALERTTHAPGSPQVGFFDEFQDFTPLEIALVRHWGEQMERLIIAGDDDQVLYQFKGASPHAFLHPPVPDDQKEVLEQSWRVPRAVHAYASRWIERVDEREPKNYRPRDHDGEVVFDDTLAWERPDGIAEQAARHARAGRTVMVLASCAYMLEPVRDALRAEAVPFHNPYRRSRGDWNPLGAGRGVPNSERVAAFLKLKAGLLGDGVGGEWFGADLKLWAAALSMRGIMPRGAKKKIEALDDDAELDPAFVVECFNDDAVDAIRRLDLDWFEGHLMASRRSASMRYALAIARRHPPDLVDEPRVTIGTIHSVKGGQADVVYVVPDLSKAALREWESPEGHDAVVRQFYVAMTRAREALVVCDASSDSTIDKKLLRSCAA